MFKILQMCFLSGAVDGELVICVPVWPGAWLTRELEVVMPEAGKIQGQEKEAVVRQAVCSRLGMCVKGCGTWEGAFVWDISIF